MKEQYIRQVKHELHVPRGVRNEIMRDLDEMFASASEHGETEQQVIERLGPAKEFAGNAAEQFGAGSAASAKRGGLLAGGAALLVAGAAFAAYAALSVGKAPADAIGQADAMTNIQVEGLFGFDASQAFLALGLIAACTAAVLIFRGIRRNRRQP